MKNIVTFILAELFILSLLVGCGGSGEGEGGGGGEAVSGAPPAAELTAPAPSPSEQPAAELTAPAPSPSEQPASELTAPAPSPSEQTALAIPKGALIIEKQGNFSAGGTVVTSDGEFNPMEPYSVQQGGQTRHGDHADVFYQIPFEANGISMVFLHGYGQSRRSWQTTADGRDGFNNFFLREGYGVYLVDQPGRGEAGQVTGPGSISATPEDQTWFTQFRIGLWPDFYEGIEFPKDEESLDQFFRMMTPDTGTTKEPYAVVEALSEVFDRAGPGVLFTHSAGATDGWLTAVKNENVLAVVALEPGLNRFLYPLGKPAGPAESSEASEVSEDPAPSSESQNEALRRLIKIPIIIYFGDNIPAEETGIPSQDFWRDTLKSARDWADYINDAGGDVTVVHLPEIGIKGNTHFLMSDLNSDIIAEHVIAWLKEKRLYKNEN
jgi:pimeloyl-ACP methyl ester carboxylesterase